MSPSPDQRRNPDLPALPAADRLRTAWHVLRTGDDQPAAAYLRGVRHGLNVGVDLALRQHPHSTQN